MCWGLDFKEERGQDLELELEQTMNHNVSIEKLGHQTVKGCSKHIKYLCFQCGKQRMY